MTHAQPVTTATLHTQPVSTTPSTCAAEVTAAIEVTATGAAYLRVTIDGDQVAFEMSPHSLRLRRITETAEAERLLRKHAGYQPTSGWATDGSGHLTATVGEITGRCTTCVHGCGCQRGDTGCGHYQCPAAAAEVANTCDGAALPLSAKRTYPKAARRTVRR
jgi:hypothetical protein